MTSMKIGSGLRIRKAFPDLRIPQNKGQYSGLLTGLQVMNQLSWANKYNALQDASIGIRLKELGMKGKSAGKISFNNLLTSFNKDKADISKRIDKIDKLNLILSVKGKPTLPVPTMPTFREWLQNSELAQYADIPVSWQTKTPLVSPAQNTVGSGLSPATAKLRNFAISQIPVENRGAAIRGFAEGGIVNKPTMAMVGEQGKEYIAPASKLDPTTQKKLEQLLGKPNAGSRITDNDALQQGLTTEQLIAALDDYDNVDDAIADLVELDRQYNQPGLAFADNIDYDAFREAFIAKFGEAGYRKLERSVQ